ncbi:MAG TPA: hypothetical protein VGK53_03130 [Propionicimonas sp.]
MAIITLTSASGSPGVTTTALGLALVWPRPVLLVEADPTGGSALLAGYWRGQLDHVGLLDLVLAERHGVLADALPRMQFPIEGSDASLLVGTKAHEQAGSLDRLWDPLLGVLQNLSDQDVIVDAGRLGLDGSPRSLLTYSDVTLLLTLSSLRALAAARSWAATLAADVVPGHEVKVVIVGEGRKYRAREVTRTLGLPVAGSIEWDPRRAEVFADGASYPVPRFGGEQAASRAFEQSGYMRSLRTLAVALRPAHLEQAAAAIEVEESLA